jgi:GDPmannose 4,6-dehydratase
MKVLITGIYGQDGYYLAKLLINKGYELFGIPNFKSNNKSSFVKKEMINHVNIIDLNLHDYESTLNFLSLNHFDHIYHLASTVVTTDDKSSFGSTYLLNFVPAINIINALIHISFGGKFFFASSALIFGSNPSMSPQTENSSFGPDTAYGIAKLHIQNYINLARANFNLNFKSGIFYNHDSYLRSDKFVLKKIIKSAIQIFKGRVSSFYMGNINSSRDWLHASDAVLAAAMIMESNLNEDFIIGSGRQNKISSVIDIVFRKFDLNYLDFIHIDNDLVRKNDSSELIANSEKIRKKLGWQPLITFDSMIDEMIEYEMSISNDH